MEHHWRYDKILSKEKAAEVAARLKNEGKRLVTLNGSFDVLHAGHLDFLEEARQEGDVLFIGLNSDRSVREGKGEGRPIIPETQRAALLVALACVDYVVILDESYADVPHVLLRTVQPDVHVNGSEYGAPETWIEWPTMREVGSSGYTVERRPGLATSEIIEKIKGLNI